MAPQHERDAHASMRSEVIHTTFIAWGGHRQFLLHECAPESGRGTTFDSIAVDPGPHTAEGPKLPA